MTLLTENPWPLIVFLGCVAAGLVALWSQRQQARFLVGAMALLACMIGAYVTDQLVVTPREEVQATVQGIVRAFQRGNVEETHSYISRQALSLRWLVSAAASMVEVGDDLRVSDLRVELVARNSRAIAKFRANATVKLRGSDFKEFQPTRWETTWQQEEGEWKLVKLQELDPITGQELHRFQAYLGRVPGF